MKTLKLICGAALTSAMFLVSCGGGVTPVTELNDKADSVNYAFGVANGAGIRSYVIAADTADADKANDFAKGFSEAFGKLSSEKRVEIEALAFAQSFMKDVPNGCLFGDETIKFDEKIFDEAMNKSIRGEETAISDEQGRSYVQMALYIPLDSGAVRTQGQVDSLNLAYATVNGSVARQYILAADTTEKFVKIFMNNFAKGRKEGASSKAYFDGLSIAMNIYKHISKDKGFMGDETLELRENVIEAAIISAVKGEKLLMDASMAQQYFNAYLEAKTAVETEKLAAEGRAFLEENKTKEGVQVTESGLQYVVNELGKGAKPTAESTVKVHYAGRLIDGTEFDSSIKRGEPISFPLANVIKGWTEGLQLMPVGSKFTFYIPYELAYGENGSGQSIPPCATLIFDVELIDIEK